MFFDSIKTAEDLKKAYKEAVKNIHPDNRKDRDTTKEFQQMQEEYKRAWERCKNNHRSESGETYTKETEETAEDFIDIIEKLRCMSGICVEICGSWLWITGNTYQHKESLKETGCGWSKSKAAWYYHKEPYHKRSKKSVSLDHIREMYGSEKVSTDGQKSILTAD